MTSVSALSCSASRSTSERLRLARALRVAWTWPAGPEAESLQRDFGSRPAAPGPGETLLVAVASSGDQSTTSLWHFRRKTSRTVASLGPEADACVDEACRLVTHALPYTTKDIRGTLLASAWAAEGLWSDDGAMPHVVDGASVGLGVRMAVASWLMDRPLPADLCFSATTADAVAVGPVAEATLPAKVRSLAANAPGIRRMVVHASQVELCRAGLENAHSLEVVGVDTVRDAFEVAWPGVYEAPPAAFHDPKVADSLATLLHRTALWNRSPLFDWTCIARPAAWLGAMHPALPAARRLAVTESIASRHAASRVDILRVPDDRDLAALHLPERFRLLAHVVQSQLDGGAPDALATARAAAQLVEDAAECECEGLALRGAVGRVLGVLAPDEAVPWLQATVEAWLASPMPQGLARPWCELVRVLGLRATEAAEADAALDRHVRELDDFKDLLDAHDLHHVLLAAGRALALAQRYPAAVRHLDDSAYRWSELIPELCDLRRRWLARALVGCDRLAEAAAHRSAVQTPWVRELVALDELVEVDASCNREPDIAMLAAKYGGLVDLVRASMPAGTPSPARWLADRFPY